MCNTFLTSVQTHYPGAGIGLWQDDTDKHSLELSRQSSLQGCAEEERHTCSPADIDTWSKNHQAQSVAREARSRTIFYSIRSTGNGKRRRQNTSRYRGGGGGGGVEGMRDGKVLINC